MLRRIVALAGVVALASVALAGPQAVASRAHVINAGVVILDSSKQSNGLPASAAPFAFYNLDRARAVKPAGWQFNNPHAPSIVTADIVNRWGATLGTRITKAQSPYWEVFLTNASDTALSDYDVLLVAPRFFVSLNPAEREKLRKFVDKGGLLWIDPAAMASSSSSNFGFDETNNFPLPFAVSALTSGSVLDQSDFSHPLLTTPNALSQRDMRLINGNGSLGLRQVDLADEGAEAIGPFEYPVLEDFFKLRAVSVDTQGGTTLPTISVGRIGDGFVVVTARGAAINLNGGDLNTGYTSSATLDSSGQASARLAINMVSMLNDFRQASGGTRKTNSTIADVTAPLLKRWEASVATSPDPHVSQPVIYKGFIYVSIGDRVRCYEANPTSLTSPELGYVWESDQIAGPISAPVAIDVPDVDRVGLGMPEEQVLVTNGAGSLFIIDATPPQAGQQSNNPRKPFPPIDPPSASNSTSSPIPPTVDEGTAYVVDTTAGQNSTSAGRVWMADLRRGEIIKSSTAGWAIGGQSADFPAFGSSATVADIPTSDNSGAIDKVLYIPFNPSGVALGPSVAGFSSIWVGTKGEKPVSYQVDTTAAPTVLQVDTRALQAGNLPIYTPAAGDQVTQGSFGPRIVLLKKVNGVATGDVFSASELKDIFTGQVDGPDGQLRFALTAGHDDTWFANNVAGVRVDYSIDWGRAVLNSVAQSVERGRITFSSNDTGRQILGNLAVTARGTVFAVYADPDKNNRDTSHIGNGGTVYAFKEDAGRGSFRCVMRYDLYPTHTINPAQGSAVTYATNFQDLDAVQGYLPTLLGGDVQNMVFMGGPCVRGDQVFVLAAGQKLASAIPVDVSVLLAFKSEPDTPTIKVGDLGDGVSLVQPDFLRTPDANRKQPQVSSILQSASFKYERDTGTIRIDNLMGITRGQIQNCLSLSQPVLVRRVGQGDTLVEPEATGGRWTPLQWYAVLHGLQLRQQGSSTSVVTTPVAAGSTLYLAGTSLLPKILASGLNPLPTSSDYRGMCYGLNVDLGTSDQFVVATPGRTWNHQFVQLLTTTTGFTPNTNVVWPQFEGITDYATLTQRVNQTVLGSGSSASHTAYGIVAGGNAAVAWGELGVYAYTRADVLVCDQNRVARYDAAGNLLWSSDASLNSGENGESTVGQVKPLMRPTRAYPIGNNDLLVVDSGGNRVVRINQAGIETRTIDKIRLDSGFIPDGWQPNESKTFNNPHDVTTFSEYVDVPAKPVVTNQGATEYWTHYVVADTGNKRLVELIDRYNVDSQGRILDPVLINNVPQLGVLLWHSPSALSGKGFAYSSLARVYVPGTSGNGHYSYVAGIGTSTPTRSSFGLDQPVGAPPIADNGGNGGFVLFDPTLTTGSQVYNTLTLPDLSSTKFWNETTNTWDLGTGLSVAGHDKRIGSVNSVTAVASGNTIAVMIADTSGIYEGTITTGGTSTGQTMTVDWMLPNAAYRALRRTDPTTGTVPGSPLADNATNLNATYARRLDSGEILIVNGYAGSTRGTKASNGTFVNRSTFLGEVIQIDGDAFDLTLPNLGFYGPNAIKYELRGVTNGRDIIMPVYADRR